MNYFEVFDLPKLLNIDLKALERKFHDLSRQYHPDYYNTASEDARQESLRQTALINDAYRTLRHPVQRIEYLLQLEGFRPDGSKVPKAFLMDVFEINEQLDEIKSGGGDKEKLAELRREISRRGEEFKLQLQQAASEWDALLTAKGSDEAQKAQLAKLTEILSESSYIRNLERDLEVIS
jgi:molecular chaperone HscB